MAKSALTVTYVCNAVVAQTVFLPPKGAAVIAMLYGQGILVLCNTYNTARALRKKTGAVTVRNFASHPTVFLNGTCSTADAFERLLSDNGFKVTTVDKEVLNGC